MKICLALPRAQVGGSFVFLRNFRDYLTRQNIPWTHDLQDAYDVLFLNSWTIPYSQVWRAKQQNPHLRVIHRIDGAAQDYGRYDGVDWLQRDVNALADLTIFQSQYSYQATYERYHLIRQTGPIIHNPVDSDRFTPQGQRLDWENHSRRVVSVGWSPNPMKGNWRIPILARQNPEVEFVVVGRSDDSLNLPNIRRVDYLEHDKLPEALRSAGVYLSLIQNDACPNVIVEALASGLPVLYIASGGVPELVREAGLAFTDETDFRPQLEAIFARRSDFAQQARQTALTHHQPDHIFGRYLAEIQASTRQPMPPRWVNWRAWGAYRAFTFRDEARRWQRILTGQQPLRKAKS